jgi:hypothetical protein
VEDGITVEEEVEYPEEQYDEEEVVEDDDGDEEEVEVTEGNDEYEEEEVVSERKLQSQPSLDMDEEQAVFQALEDAERAERSFPPPPAPVTPKEIGAPEQSSAVPQDQPPTSSYKSREAMPQRDEDKCRQNTIILLVILVGLIAIAALVIPFVYDFNRNDDSTSGGPDPTEAPVVSPTDPPSPTVSPSPTAEFPTAAPAPTIAPDPTFAPTTMRLNQFIEQFLIPVSGEEVFQDKTSPQFRAAVYISDEDPFTSELATLEQLEDRYAAITFYYATSGDDWTQCYLGDEACPGGHWLVDDVCGWFAVSCDEVGRITGILFGT